MCGILSRNNFVSGLGFYLFIYEFLFLENVLFRRLSGSFNCSMCASLAVTYSDLKLLCVFVYIKLISALISLRIEIKIRSPYIRIACNLIQLLFVEVLWTFSSFILVYMYCFMFGYGRSQWSRASFKYQRVYLEFRIYLFILRRSQKWNFVGIRFIKYGQFELYRFFELISNVFSYYRLGEKSQRHDGIEMIINEIHG